SVANADDVRRARRGDLPADQVRRVELPSVLVDTGANSLCLPSAVIALLGLDLIREVQVETAAGMSTARLFGDVSLSIQGRSAPFECLELPGDMALLGVLPLETLGAELDLQNNRLTLLPEHGRDTFHTAI
ncbi:MAG: aspartyl protease family protein, partial [Anaerolineales bacterium]